MSKKSPAFQFYPKDFLADENVMVMELAEVGAYVKLMCVCWNEGSIPADPKRLARLCGCPSKDFEGMWPQIRPCFEEGPDGRLRHLRLEKERNKQAKWRRQKSEAGKLGAAKRWGDKPSPPPDGGRHSSAIAQPMADDSFAVCSLQSSVSTASEAKASGRSPVVESCGKLDGPPPESTPWEEAAGWWAPFLREHSVEPKRSMSVVQQNLRKHRPETIRDAVLGFCAMRDAGELREGLGWAPGETITLLPLNKSTNGRSNLQLAADRWRKASEAKGSRSGMKLIKDVLGAA